MTYLILYFNSLGPPILDPDQGIEAQHSAIYNEASAYEAMENTDHNKAVIPFLNQFVYNAIIPPPNLESNFAERPRTITF